MSLHPKLRFMRGYSRSQNVTKDGFRRISVEAAVAALAGHWRFNGSDTLAPEFI